MSRFLLLLSAMLFIFAFSALPAGAQDDEPIPPEEALLRDAAEYAKTFGVDLEEALRRLALMDKVGFLQYQLVTQEGETFGGLWIEHTPVFKLVVKFTKNGEETLGPYIVDSPLADLIEVRMTDVSLVALEAEQQTAMTLVRLTNIPVDSGINIQKSVVEVYVVQREELESALQDLGVQFPPHVAVVTVEHLSQPAPGDNNTQFIALPFVCSG